MSVRCREGPAAHSVWFPHFLPHGGKHLQEGLQLFFFLCFFFIKPITFPFFWWYTAWSGMFSFLSSPFFAFWMCRSVWSDRNTFFFFLLTYRNKNPYTGIIVIYCCCCFSCLLFLLCIDNFTDCHFLFYVCFFSLSHLVEYGDRWEYVLTSYWDLSLHAHKQTNTRISLWKKGPRHFSSAPFQRQLRFYYIFLHVIYTSYGCGVLNGCQRHGVLWQDQDLNCSSFMSSAVFFPPLFLCAWFLLLFASLPEPVESSQNHLRNHFFAVPSRIIRTSGFHMED